MTTETKLEERVRALEVDHAKKATLLEEHVASCDRRNNLILKLVMWAFFGILILVVEQTFSIHIPTNIPTIP